MRYTDIHSTDLHVTPDSPISHTWRPAECRSPKTPTTGTRDNSICRTLAVEELLNYSRNCIHLYEENPMQDFWHEIPVLFMSGISRHDKHNKTSLHSRLCFWRSGISWEAHCCSRRKSFIIQKRRNRGVVVGVGSETSLFHPPTQFWYASDVNVIYMCW